MQNLIKSLISLVIILAMLALVFPLSVSAAGSVISFSKNSLAVGDTVTVTIALNAEESMYAVECIVNYDASVLEYKWGVASGGAGTLRIVESPSGEKNVSYALTFVAKAAGNSNISVSNCFCDGLFGEKRLSGVSATINVFAKNLVFIAVTKNPEKIEYCKGTKFDTTGMELTVFYDNNTYEIITTGFETEYDFSEIGQRTVTIKYGEMVTTIPVTVTDKIIKSIILIENPEKTEYTLGNNFDSTGMVLAILYYDNTYEKITTGWTEEYDFSEPGQRKVIIGYSGKTTQLAVTVIKDESSAETKGDINFDGIISAEDLTVLKKNMFGITDDDLKPEAYDINGDAEVNILDFIQLKKLLIKA